MTSTQLQAVIRARPFRPFTIRLADGRAVDVPHPEVIAHCAGGGIAAVSLPGDSFAVIDLPSIVSLDVRPLDWTGGPS